MVIPGLAALCTRLQLLSPFRGLKVSLVLPRRSACHQKSWRLCVKRGMKCSRPTHWSRNADVDIVYSTRIQEERFASPEEADRTEVVFG